MKLIIAGDLVPTKTNIKLFNNSDILTLLGEELIKIWNSADIRIFNLEAPITDTLKPINKCGPNLQVPSSAINGIKKLNPTVITLANNHILDQDVEGLIATQQILIENEIPFVGIGENIENASEPFITTKDNKRIGIYACAENEFSIAAEKTPGANPFDPLESLEHINNLKSKCDYVLVLYHGGKEHYRYPSPYLQKVCRKMIDKGADLIVCQHSHCIGCYEEYKDSTIVYGQGNFIFDNKNDEYWNTSLLVNIEINNDIKVEYIPITKISNKVRLASKTVGSKILSDFISRSKEIIQKGFIDKKYNELAQDRLNSYLRKISGYGKWVSRIDRSLLKGFLLKRRYNKKKLLTIQNYMECEAHRELLLTGLKNQDESKS